MNNIRSKNSFCKYLKLRGYSNFELTEHNQSGRNKLYIVKEDNSQPWLLKKHLHTPFEIWFYESYPNYFQKPEMLMVDKKNNLIGLKYYTEGHTLFEINVQSQERCLRLLSSTAVDLAALHNLPVYKDKHNAQLFLPDIDPVHIEFWQSASPALKRLIYLLQNQGISSNIKTIIRNQKPIQGLIHGDLKLDNILVVNESFIFLDWELSGIGDLSWDIASIIGSMVIIWLDNLDIDDGDDPSLWENKSGVRFELLNESVNSFITIYLDNINSPVRQQLTIDYLVSHTIHWLIMRTWAEASQSTELNRQQLARLLFIAGFLENPSLLINPYIFNSHA
ncbi:MAG: phosphotransferase [Candidatus Pacebacteria bacterium]|nr:phosphotransferase [Candidatus Paceibacterota bacterium]